MSDHTGSVRRLFAAMAAVALIASFLTTSVPAAHALVSPQAAGSNFNSSFNGSHSGWSSIDGSTWNQDASHFSTVGLVGKFSSTKHSGSYGNFVYQVKMRRDGSTLAANVLWVRGNPTPNLVNEWNSGYGFGYNGIGEFQVVRFTGGVLTIISPPLTSPYIVPGGGWNVFKVVFYGPAYLFYANGVLLWAGFDPTYTDGSVGIGMQGGGPGQKLVVDWAKLSKIVGDPGPLPTPAPGSAVPPLGGSDLFVLP